MKYTAFLVLLFLISACSSQPGTKEEKSSSAFVAFKFPTDSFTVLDSLADPHAVLLVTKFDDFWGANAFVMVMTDSGQRNIELNYHSLSTIKSGKLEAIQLDGKNTLEIIARTKGDMRTDLVKTGGYFTEQISAVDVIDVQKSKVLFSAMPSYLYEQTGTTPIKEEVTYNIAVTAEGIKISNRAGEKSRNYPDTVNADCYELLNGKYIRCK